jgi:chaperone modulatory protein CbpM
MTLNELEFLQRAGLDQETLKLWVEEEWLIPSRNAHGLTYTEIDLARVNLIRDLKHNLGVNEEGLGVILHLLDQMHGLRRALAELLATFHSSTPPREK